MKVGVKGHNTKNMDYELKQQSHKGTVSMNINLVLLQ
jgi:hypothetical protein